MLLMHNIKLHWIPTKIRKLNKKIPPTLLLVLQSMPISGFEKLAFLLFLVGLDQLVTPSVWNFSEHQNRKKENVWHSPLSSVLLTKFKFALSVSSVWSPGLIEKLTIMKWPCDLQKVGTGSQVATFLTLFWRKGLNQKKLK